MYEQDRVTLFDGRQNENPLYLSSQLLTYLGNKRALLDFIDNGVQKAAQRLGKRRLRIFDAFSGSGIVSRFFKRSASSLVCNDLEAYSEVINRCYLSNSRQRQALPLREAYAWLRENLASDANRSGFVQDLYAPADDGDIKPGERVFYTRRNAAFLDSARQYIGELDESVQPFFLAPLLSEASIHANTSGVFKGYYKNKHNGIGQFGGTQRAALSRITSPIELPFPVFSNYDCDVEIFRTDTNSLASQLADLDLAYLDPPYNQHPYGSNYFMLNLLVSYQQPLRLSRVSGIPDDWQRSAYNVARQAESALRSLVGSLQAKFLLVSFNSEGFIRPAEMVDMLSSFGRVEVLETRYNTFRASRNLAGRPVHVKEYLYLMEKS